MTTILGIVCGLISAIIFFVLIHFSGYKAGYESGRKDADNWWLGVEAGADRARQEIWRKEAQL